MACEYCGAEYYEIDTEGAPCGYNECSIFTCCIKAWEDHMRSYHKEEPEIVIR